MIRAVLLDMDGVLIDSERHWHSIEGAWLRSVIPGWQDEHQKECIGLSMSGLYEMLQLKYGLAMVFEDFRLAYMSLAESIYQESADLMPHCRTFLNAARRAGVKLAVVSSSPKPWIQIIVNRFEIEDYFSKLVSADDVRGIGKPDPAVYLHAADQLSESPAHCAAIEDSENGILSAHRAGMRCIGFRNGWNDAARMDLAHQIIHGFSETALQSILALPTKLSGSC
jgi:HAD superfamily hydrolase (TIGR01509 family)